jgi:hypothetical protein
MSIIGRTLRAILVLLQIIWTHSTGLRSTISSNDISIRDNMSIIHRPDLESDPSRRFFKLSLPQASVLSLYVSVVLLFVCICFTELGFRIFDCHRRRSRRVGRASGPDFLFRSSAGSLHWTSISINRHFMATEGCRRRRWCAVRPMFDTGMLAFRRRQGRHRYLENTAIFTRMLFDWPSFNLFATRTPLFWCGCSSTGYLFQWYLLRDITCRS